MLMIICFKIGKNGTSVEGNFGTKKSSSPNIDMINNQINSRLENIVTDEVSINNFCSY